MPEPSSVQVTPSGMRIEFFDGSEGTQRKYLVDGQRLPSVTTVLNVLDKPALKSWAERIGVQGAIALARDGALPQDEHAALARMRERDLCWWQARDKAAGRGTLAHEDLIALVLTGEVPDLSLVPAGQRGFVRGVCAWHADTRWTVIAAEQMVASTEHGFAGRFDLRMRTPGGDEVLADLKTTESLLDRKGQVKAPYDESMLQLAAYELASVESGHPATAGQFVVRVDARGRHDTTRSWAQGEDFLGVLAAHRGVRALHARKPRRPRAKAAA